MYIHKHIVRYYNSCSGRKIQARIFSLGIDIHLVFAHIESRQVTLMGILSRAKLTAWFSIAVVVLTEDHRAGTDIYLIEHLEIRIVILCRVTDIAAWWWRLLATYRNYILLHDGTVGGSHRIYDRLREILVYHITGETCRTFRNLVNRSQRRQVGTMRHCNLHDCRIDLGRNLPWGIDWTLYFEGRRCKGFWDVQFWRQNADFYFYIWKWNDKSR